MRLTLQIIGIVDPAFSVNADSDTDPDPDPSGSRVLMTKKLEKYYS